MYPFNHVRLVKIGDRVCQPDIPSPLNPAEQSIVKLRPHVGTNPLRQSGHADNSEQSFGHGFGGLVLQRLQEDEPREGVLTAEYVMTAFIFRHPSHDVTRPEIIRECPHVPGKLSLV